MEFFREVIYDSKKENRDGLYILNILNRIGFEERVGCLMSCEGHPALSFSLTSFNQFLNQRYKVKNYLKTNGIGGMNEIFKKVKDDIISINLEYANVLDMDNEDFGKNLKDSPTTHPFDFYHYDISITESAYAEIALQSVLNLDQLGGKHDK